MSGYEYVDEAGAELSVWLAPATGSNGPTVVLCAEDAPNSAFVEQALVRVPLAEAHVLAAAILAPLLPHASEVTIDLDGYRFTEGKRA